MRDITPDLCEMDFDLHSTGEPSITETVLRQLWLVCPSDPGVDLLMDAALRLLHERDDGLETRSILLTAAHLQMTARTSRRPR
jgi:hypothetical protein